MEIVTKTTTTKTVVTTSTSKSVKQPFKQIKHKHGMLK